MNKELLIKEMIVNTSVGATAIRNQGNGIAEVIREKIISNLSFGDFFSS